MIEHRRAATRLTIVSDFLVRSVVDEALPPRYLGDRVFAALGGEVVTRARRLLSREHALSKLERIWGPGTAATWVLTRSTTSWGIPHSS